MRKFAAIMMLLCCMLFLIPTGLAAEDAGPDEKTPEQQAEEELLRAIGNDTAVKSMEVTVYLDERGRAEVTQIMEVRFVGQQKTIRFSVPDNAKKVKVKGYRAKEKKEQDVRYYEVTDKEGFRGEQTFEITYEIRRGLVSETKESQTLKVPLLTVQDFRVGQCTVAVELPNTFESTPRFISGYYGDDIEDVMNISVEGKWVVAGVNRVLQDNETLTLNLVLPVGFFEGNHGESALPTVMTIIVLLLLAGAVFYWLRLLKSPAIKVRTRTLPPDGVTPGDLPFLLSGGNTDFNMLVSHWAVLGYLSIHVSKSGHVVLRQRMAMGNERRTMEQKLFAMLFAENGVCDGASIRYKKVGEKAMQVTRSYWSKRLYEKHSGAPLIVTAICSLACGLAAIATMSGVAPDAGRGFFLFLSLIAGTAMGYMICGIGSAFYLSQLLRLGIGVGSAVLLLIVGFVGSGLISILAAVAVSLWLGWKTCHGGQRSAYGQEIISQTLGFRRFLLHASEQHVMQMQMRDSQYFYKLLPYAEAMGQGSRFVSLFRDCKLEPCQWYNVGHGNTVSAQAFYEHYKETLDMLNMSIKK